MRTQRKVRFPLEKLLSLDENMLVGFSVSRLNTKTPNQLLSMVEAASCYGVNGNNEGAELIVLKLTDR